MNWIGAHMALTPLALQCFRGISVHAAMVLATELVEHPLAP